MIQAELDWSRKERDAGMAQALAHAEEVTEDWGTEAYGLLGYWCLGERGVQFTSYVFLQWVETQSLAAPPTPKAWGSIFVKAAKNGLIRKAGYRPHPLRHASPTVLWEVL